MDMGNDLQPSILQHQDPDEGDFTLRSLPKTYEYFIKNRLYEKLDRAEIDNFDFFVCSNVTILQFMNDQYYAHKKNPTFRLDQLCGDPTALRQLDDAILLYVSNKKSHTNLMRLQNHYIIVIENCLMKLMDANLHRSTQSGEP